MASVRPLSILIVDDNDRFRGTLSRFLSASGILGTPWYATSGEQAIVAAVANHPDVVLMDLSMPGMGGLEATRRIKAIRPEQAVILLTAHDSADRIRAEAAAADGFVSKSHVAEQLVGLIASLRPGREVGV